MKRQFNLFPHAIMRQEKEERNAVKGKNMKSVLDLQKKKATTVELQEYFGIEDYLEFCSYVKQLEKKGMLVPVKSSRFNGKTPPLYQAYHIIKNSEDNEAYRKELLYQLSLELNPSYYIKHMEDYKRDRHFVLLLSSYMKRKKENLSQSVSLNERSFEIFHREKYLKGEGGKRLLKNLDFSIERLNIYDAKEPISYYSHHKQVPQSVLIIENMDTFYSMREYLLQTDGKILGKEIGTLIYGKGKAVSKSFQDFPICVEAYLKHPENKMLYFGDLDYEGIKIYEDLWKKMKDSMRIEPFSRAYEKMVEKGIEIGIDELPMTKEGQKQASCHQFLQSFSKAMQTNIVEILEARKYIPQEILQKKDYCEETE